MVDRVVGVSYVLDKFRQPTRTHRLAVTAVDASGNESALSAPVEVTLLRK